MFSQLFRSTKASPKGFTLIEILIVIGIIAILAAIVIIAINPAKQFAQARNTQRESGINSILNAIGQRISDNKGVFAGEFEIDGKNYECPALTAVDDAAEIEAEGAGCLVPTYIASLPKDPSGSEYEIDVTASGRVTVCAPKANDEAALPEGNPELCVTR